MPREVRASTLDDLPDLGRFLIKGFQSPTDAEFAATDVMDWKYFDPRGRDAGDSPRSYLARDSETGQIIGHLGVCPSRFRGVGLIPEGASTLHAIDWLADGSAPGVGLSLLRRAHQSAETAIVLGGSEAARSVMSRCRYQLVASVSMYQRVLRLDYRLRAPGPRAIGRILRAGKDAASALARPSHRPRIRVEIRPVESFGPEIEPALASYATRAVFSSRGPDQLNHLLRYPRGGFSGWHLLIGGELRGFAVLAVLPRPGGIRIGRIVDFLLDDPDGLAWHGAAHALTGELKRRGADVALAFASTAWTALAFRLSGYSLTSALEFRLRDPSNLIPPDSTFHLTPLEADYAHL